MTTKIHAAVNDSGKVVKLTLTPGQRHDITEAGSLLEEIKAEHVIADKAYDSDDLREIIRKGGGKPVIPSRKGIRRRSYNKELYKLRNVIERFFNRLKHFRRIATRYDKTDASLMGFLTFAAILLNAD